MSDKENPQSVIDAYKKRQKMMPILVKGLAILLAVVGVIILVVWFTGGSNGPRISLFASATPTATSTATPTPVTPTSTPTFTPTVTDTPIPTNTATPSGPFEYTVQENDNCWGIANQFEVDLVVLLALNNFGSACPINPGDKILIPAPGQELPTATPFPTDLARGTKITYIVKSGDTLAGIASRFDTTVEDIILQNELKDANAIIFAGQELIVRVYLVTPTITTAPTSTSAVTATAPAATTAAPTP